MMCAPVLYPTRLPVDLFHSSVPGDGFQSIAWLLAADWIPRAAGHI